MGRHAEKRASPSRVVTRLRGLRKVRALSQRKEWAKKKKKKEIGRREGDILGKSVCLGCGRKTGR